MKTILRCIELLIIGILILGVISNIEYKLELRKEDCKEYETYVPKTFITISRCYISDKTKFCLNLKGYFPDINCTID